jgi:hypothetical protein
MQVHSLDGQLRGAPQGYGHLSLAQHHIGCASHTINTWRPMPSLEQRVQEWFVGGGPALKNVDFVAYPGHEQGNGGSARVAMNKVCTVTEPGGSVRVRTMCAVHFMDRYVFFSVNARTRTMTHVCQLSSLCAGS